MALENIKVNEQLIVSVDDEPNFESDNLVKSGGVYDMILSQTDRTVNLTPVSVPKYEVGTLPLPGEVTIRIRSSEYIPVQGNKLFVDYASTKYRLDIYFYESDTTPISETEYLIGKHVVDVPENAAFMKFLVSGYLPTTLIDFTTTPYDDVYTEVRVNWLFISDKPFNYIPNRYIKQYGTLSEQEVTGVNVSNRILIENNVFTWNYGISEYITDAKLVIFDNKMNVLDYFTIMTDNIRTIDLSGRSYADDPAYIMFSFSEGGSLIQGSKIWRPTYYTKKNTIVEKLDVCTYNVGLYRRQAAYMSDEDKAGFLKQLKTFMNGKINKDILFTQEDVESFTADGIQINTYETYYRQFYPYKYLCRNNWSCIYSKYPLKNCREFAYAYTPTGGTEQHRYHALAEVEINGKLVGIASIHCNFHGDLQEAEYNAIIDQMKDYDYAIVAGDFNLYIQQSEIGDSPLINRTFGKAGYKTANWGYWGNIHTQTDVNAEGQVAAENQIDSFIVKGFDINSFDVLPVAYYDHMPCVSNLNFSLY